MASQEDKDALKAWVQGLCTNIPGNLDNECSVLVSKYMDRAIDSIMSALPADAVCVDLKMCVDTEYMAYSDISGTRLETGHWYHNKVTGSDVTDVEWATLDQDPSMEARVGPKSDFFLVVNEPTNLIK